MVLRAFAAWLLIAALLLVVHAGNIAARRFPDPDDALRLLQVRDLLAGQSWFDLAQHRIDALHGGVAMHWSRLVDIPLLGTIAVLTPLLGAATAELVTLVAIPLVTLFIAVLLAARISWRLLDREAATLTCLIIALSVPLLFQFQPLRIDHHGWQIVCALAAANGLLSRDARRGATVIGLSLAAWLAISIEGLPLTLGFGAVLALRWLRDTKQRFWLSYTLQALALGSLVLFAATRGFGDLSVRCDAISPPYFALLCWAALGTTLLAAPRLPQSWVVAGFLVIAGGGAGIAMLAAPQCLGGGFAGTDPLVREVWLSQVMEGMPLWRQSPASILQLIVLPALGLVAAVMLYARSADWMRQFWFEYAVLLLAAIGVAVLVSRAGATAGALASVPLGWLLARWLDHMRSAPGTGRNLLAAAAIALALMPTLPLTIAAPFMPASAASATPPRAADCDVSSAASVVGRLPAGEIASTIDIAPELLLHTRHSVIATGHHRGQAGIKATIELFTAPPEKARVMLARRGTAYLALCPDLMETGIYAARNPKGLAAQLRAGSVPAWLDPVDTRVAGFDLWTIKRP